jgi:hypothetical protein
MAGEISLDPARLENVKQREDGSIRAACPACRAEGSDKSGDHLLIKPDGKFGCATHKDDGEHRKKIFALAGRAKSNGLPAKSIPAFYWTKCVADFTDSNADKLAAWRGISVEFVRWLHTQGTVGIFDGKIAFANHGVGGAVVSAHIRLENGDWIFEPKGQRTAPLVFGNPKAAGKILAFESQWDAFAIMDKFGWHTSNGLSDTAVIITRGAGNGKLITGQVSPDAVCYAFKQNDVPTPEKPTPAGDVWLADLACNAGCEVLNVATPAPHKDANDWTRVEATDADLQDAMKSAKPVKQPAAPVADTNRADIARECLGEESEPPIDIAARLALVRFNIHIPPPLETAVFKLSNGTTTHTRGNISAITAQAKAGKTAFNAALIATGITDRPDDCDGLGFRAVNPDGLPILLFDTEHSPEHHWKLCDRIFRRAMLTESGRLHAYRLAVFTVKELNAALAYLLAERKWHSVFLDGTGDFVSDVNDPEECNAFVSRLHGLAIEYDTHILNVLHLNPSSETKSRGHLGSQLERKSETNLRIEKKDGVSIVYSDRNRGADIPKDTAPRFVWSVEHQMHISADSIGSVKLSANLERLCTQRDEAFRISGKTALFWGELREALRGVPGIKSVSKSDRVLRDLKTHKLVAQNPLKQYIQP